MSLLRKAIVVVLTTLCFVFPYNGNIKAAQSESITWYCTAIGNIENNTVMYITKIWSENNIDHHNEREKAFLTHVSRISHGKFYPSFNAKCRGFPIEKKTIQRRTQDVKMAKDYNFHIFELNWRWIYDDVIRKKK